MCNYDTLNVESLLVVEVAAVAAVALQVCPNVKNTYARQLCTKNRQPRDGGGLDWRWSFWVVTSGFWLLPNALRRGLT